VLALCPTDQHITEAAVKLPFLFLWVPFSITQYCLVVCWIALCTLCKCALTGVLQDAAADHRQACMTEQVAMLSLTTKYAVLFNKAYVKAAQLGGLCWPMSTSHTHSTN